MIENALLDLLSKVSILGSKEKIICLCYHQIVPKGTPESQIDRFTVYQEDFDAHLKMIKAAGYQIINPADLPTAEGPAVIITFDDNTPSNVPYALPVLVENEVSATFFLNPLELGENGLMGQDGVEALLAGGQLIGAHNARHEVVAELSLEKFLKYVEICRDFLLSLDQPLIWAYPGGFLGSYTPAHDKILRELGFQIRFSTLEGPCTPATLPEVQRRYVLRINSSQSYVKAAINGRMRELALFKKSKYALSKALK
ncbi:MAG: polysaccharide deacetylase family protein [Bacteroidota bacterium]